MRRGLDAIRNVGKHAGLAATTGAVVGGATAGYAYGKDEVFSGAAVGALAGGGMGAYQKLRATGKYMPHARKMYGGGMKATGYAASLSAGSRATGGMAAGLKAGAYGAAGGFAYATLPSNNSKGGVNYDEKFEYMKRVKKMQTDENLRMQSERYKYGKEYHQWRRDQAAASDSWF